MPEGEFENNFNDWRSKREIGSCDGRTTIKKPLSRLNCLPTQSGRHPNSRLTGPPPSGVPWKLFAISSLSRLKDKGGFNFKEISVL